jgi:hypothetical protein
MSRQRLLNLQTLGGSCNGTPLGPATTTVVVRRLLEQPGDAVAIRHTLQAALEESFTSPTELQQRTISRQLFGPFMTVALLDSLITCAERWNSHRSVRNSTLTLANSSAFFLDKFVEFQTCPEAHRQLLDDALSFTVAMWSLLCDGADVNGHLAEQNFHFHSEVWRQLGHQSLDALQRVSVERLSEQQAHYFELAVARDTIRDTLASVASNQGLIRASLVDHATVDFDPTAVPIRLTRSAWRVLSREVIGAVAGRTETCPFDVDATHGEDVWPEQILAQASVLHWCVAGLKLNLSGLPILTQIRQAGLTVTDAKEVTLGSLTWQVSGKVSKALGSSVWRPSPLAGCATGGILDLTTGALPHEQILAARSCQAARDFARGPTDLA